MLRITHGVEPAQVRGSRLHETPKKCNWVQWHRCKKYWISTVEKLNAFLVIIGGGFFSLVADIQHLEEFQIRPACIGVDPFKRNNRLMQIGRNTLSFAKIWMFMFAELNLGGIGRCFLFFMSFGELLLLLIDTRSRGKFAKPTYIPWAFENPCASASLLLGCFIMHH